MDRIMLRLTKLYPHVFRAALADGASCVVYLLWIHIYQSTA